MIKNPLTYLTLGTLITLTSLPAFAGPVRVIDRDGNPGIIGNYGIETGANIPNLLKRNSFTHPTTSSSSKKFKSLTSVLEEMSKDTLKSDYFATQPKAPNYSDLKKSQFSLDVLIGAGNHYENNMLDSITATFDLAAKYNCNREESIRMASLLSVESNFNSRARPRDKKGILLSSAFGPGQIIDGTGEEYNVIRDIRFANFDGAIRIALDYKKQTGEPRFDGPYHSGPDKWKRGDIGQKTIDHMNAVNKRLEIFGKLYDKYIQIRG